MKSRTTVFISYSWEDEKHNIKVERLVNLLKKNNIQVLWDKDLPLGVRLTDFMESIDQCDRVLCLCTPKYKEKADHGGGGVKYEKNIISAELYVKGNERKFIPVLFSGTWRTSLPIWAAGKVGIDFRNESAEAFQKLLENLGSDAVKQAGQKPNLARPIITRRSPRKRKRYKKKPVIPILLLLCALSLPLLFKVLDRKTVFDNLVLEDYENKPRDLLAVLEPELRNVLGEDYEYFTQCFYSITPCDISEDGLYMDAFVNGIADCMGGVLCVDREGHLYILLISVAEGVPYNDILYYTNYPEEASVLPITKFNYNVQRWLENYNTYHVHFKSAQFDDLNINGQYVRQYDPSLYFFYSDLAVQVNGNNTISLEGYAQNGANMGLLECSIEYTYYPDGAYAKYDYSHDSDEYLVFYFGADHVSVLDTTRSLSGAGVTFAGEYSKDPPREGVITIVPS